jgi:hypothetical protein
MKKLFAILTSLLFVVSVFGVASVMAPSLCPCDGTVVILPNSVVSVGQEFTIKVKQGCQESIYALTSEGTDAGYAGYIFPITATTEGDYFVYTYKALKPGTIYICNGACSPGCAHPGTTPYGSPASCFKEKWALRIQGANYPMLSFMKILGLGKTD